MSTDEMMSERLRMALGDLPRLVKEQLGAYIVTASGRLRRERGEEV